MTVIFAIAAAVPVFAAAYTSLARELDADKCAEFLSGYGWETEPEPHDREKVNIPAVFDEVYKSYNTMQLDAGLDLVPYAGRSGIRYTFIVTNYPTDVGEPVYADVIIIDGEPVAGDIMTVSIHGFMHSLTENAPVG